MNQQLSSLRSQLLKLQEQLPQLLEDCLAREPLLLGARPKYLLCPRIAPGFRWALAFVARVLPSAHYSPQLVAVLQDHRQIFRRLWVKQISCHLADTPLQPS